MTMKIIVNLDTNDAKKDPIAYVQAALQSAFEKVPDRLAVMDKTNITSQSGTRAGFVQIREN